MDNQDKLFNQIKSATENQTPENFPAMDKIWNRVEEKLDQKVVKKETKLWKKIAAAASILLITSIGYQFYKNQSPVKINYPVVTSDSINKEQSPEKNVVRTTISDNPIIKKDADAILKKQTESSNQVVNNYNFIISKTDAKNISDSLITTNSGFVNNLKSNNNWIGKRKFNARGVSYEYDSEMIKKQEATIQKADKKLQPLLVIDGKASQKELSNLDEEEVDSILELPEPLYIINGVYYSENELFGPNPSSPYSPLNKQKIETISILQPEKAITIYGEKGNKGVVVITTKDGKPLPKKE